MLLLQQTVKSELLVAGIAKVHGTKQSRKLITWNVLFEILLIPCPPRTTCAGRRLRNFSGLFYCLIVKVLASFDAAGYISLEFATNGEGGI